jgi:hypothetical protein
MRSLTYVHPGEQLTCVGCHEPYDRSPKPVGALPLALRRAPSEIQPEFPEGVVPPDYDKQIAPIFKRTCVGCHTKEGKGPKAIYVGKHKGRAEGDLVHNTKSSRAPRWVPDTRTNTSRTTPGHMGALGSLLWQHVQKHRAAFTKDELKRLAWWLDLSCPQTGIYGTFFKEVNGIRWPTRPDVDPENPLGVERLPEPVTAARLLTPHRINASAPVIVDDTVFITSNYGKGCVALKIANDKVTALWPPSTVMAASSKEEGPRTALPAR